LELNTDSEVQVAFSAKVRNIRLLRGEAFFHVKHDATRPFVVRSNQAAVQAVGTEFDVQRDSHSTTVAVLSGTARATAIHDGDETPADAPPPSAALATAPDSSKLVDSGQMAHVSSDTVTTVAEGTVQQTLSWRQGHLQFSEATLDYVARQINRYNRV